MKDNHLVKRYKMLYKNQRQENRKLKENLNNCIEDIWEGIQLQDWKAINNGYKKLEN